MAGHQGQDEEDRPSGGLQSVNGQGEGRVSSPQENVTEVGIAGGSPCLIKTDRRTMMPGVGIVSSDRRPYTVAAAIRRSEGTNTMSVIEQANQTGSSRTSTLPEQLATHALGWARQNGALRNMVAFSTLTEVVERGLGGKTERSELTPEDVANVQKETREWLKPYLRSGIPLDGLDKAISEGAERYKFADLEATRAKGPEAVDAQLSTRRTGAER
jgi:hypothetical protein